MSETKNRSYILGLIFTVLCPGLGHIYAGKLKIGIIILVFDKIFGAIHSSEISIQSAYSYITSLGLLLTILILVNIHCLLTIKKNKSITLQAFTKWYVYLLIFIISTSINLFIPKSYETFNIPSGAMAPTLQVGDYLIGQYEFSLERGDIVIFKYPADPKINYIKRVIAMPGDEVEISNKVIFVNNQPILTKELKIDNLKKLVHEDLLSYNFQLFESKTFNKNHQILLNKDMNYMADFKKITVPKNKYFVLGDNRDFSSDSRHWGFVPKANLYAKPKFIYFSKNKESLFERFGIKVN